MPHPVPLSTPWPLLLHADLCAAFTAAVVYIAGLVALLLRHLETKRHQGLNELANKPAFDEVWEAGKFEFQDQQGGKHTGSCGEGAGGSQAKGGALTNSC